MVAPLPEVLDAYDFESLTGLRRTDRVDIRGVPMIRFDFLADARTPNGQPVRALSSARERVSS